MRAVVLTSGDPAARTGGSLYHRRIAERSAALGVEMDLVSTDEAQPKVQATARAAAVVVVDSIVAAHVPADAFDRPVVASVHQRPGGLVGSPLARAARALHDLHCYRRADAVVVPSAYLADLLTRHGVQAGRIRVVEPGADAYHVQSADRRGRTPSFVSVANLSPHKRPLELLDAFAMLSDVDASLTLIGGAADPALGELVRARLGGPGLEGRACWLGSLAPDRVAERLGAADAFVSPAVEEAYGMAAAEALRAGLTAIVVASGNLPNLVRDGVDGFVVPPRDTPALAAAMRRLAVDGSLRAAMRGEARRAGERLPSWDSAAERFVAVLDEVQRAPASPPLRRSSA